MIYSPKIETGWQWPFLTPSLKERREDGKCIVQAQIPILTEHGSEAISEQGSWCWWKSSHVNLLRNMAWEGVCQPKRIWGKIKSLANPKTRNNILYATPIRNVCCLKPHPPLRTRVIEKIATLSKISYDLSRCRFYNDFLMFGRGFLLFFGDCYKKDSLAADGTAMVANLECKRAALLYHDLYTRTLVLRLSVESLASRH